MADETTNNTNIVDETTTQQQTQTQSVEKTTEQEKTFTQLDLNRIAAKEAAKAKAAAFKLFGVEKEEDATTAAEELKLAREAKAKAEAEKPELERQAAEIARLKTIEQERNEAQAKLQAYEQKTAVQETLKSMYGKNDKMKLETVDIDYVIYKAKQAVTDDFNFMAAVTKHLTDNPPYAIPATMAQGTGTAVITNAETERLKAEFEKAKKLRNTAEMSRITRIAQEKKIQL